MTRFSRNRNNRRQNRAPKPPVPVAQEEDSDSADITIEIIELSDPPGLEEMTPVLSRKPDDMDIEEYTAKLEQVIHEQQILHTDMLRGLKAMESHNRKLRFENEMHEDNVEFLRDALLKIKKIFMRQQRKLRKLQGKPVDEESKGTQTSDKEED
ncbi:Oidioi.mRNA.OKI2018_I69.XSR.g16012.t1.cds [Oikopleura dioica]|uniref:Oidioi.mRNA.OKI2018_I69.XSR.g16012.t1.cds n=1 Tax=Oikopleura dioica TaxID=34765 RepID=A0ABN7SIQ6_OIKDI|nr:Oidioi.mRNA.OKI2018_I69.XSR.g16012.t1.cds [Oikopleura dioica]